MNKKMAVIGVGNMAKAIISGMVASDLKIEKFYLYDKNIETYNSLEKNERFVFSKGIEDAVKNANCVLLSVKPQNFPQVLEKIRNVPSHEKKLYITIAAGITVDSVSSALNGATVIRVLPNLPMTIGKGVSAICKNDSANQLDIVFVKNIFLSAGSILMIEESEMNRIIGVTSSSPAYVFKFVDAICKGAEAQGLNAEALLDTVCDMIIGSALLLKSSCCSPQTLISKVASKGGTTEQALLKLDDGNFDKTVKDAMIACTARADELGK